MLFNDFYLIIGIKTPKVFYRGVHIFFFKIFHTRLVIKKVWHYKIKNQFF